MTSAKEYAIYRKNLEAKLKEAQSPKNKTSNAYDFSTSQNVQIQPKPTYGVQKKYPTDFNDFSTNDFRKNLQQRLQSKNYDTNDNSDKPCKRKKNKKTSVSSNSTTNTFNSKRSYTVNNYKSQ